MIPICGALCDCVCAPITMKLFMPRMATAAVAVAQKEHPDLIVLDLGLPAGDGFVVLERLQNIDTLAGIPVVVLTARDPQNNEERALKGGAAAFFQKPVDNAELLDVIRASLTDSRAPGVRPS